MTSSGTRCGLREYWRHVFRRVEIAHPFAGTDEDDGVNRLGVDTPEVDRLVKESRRDEGERCRATRATSADRVFVGVAELICGIRVWGGRIAMMNDEINPDPSELPLPVLDQIDRICDRFERAWERGERPRVEDNLGEVSGTHRSALVRDLLAAELSARRRRGEEPEPREYHERLPGDAEAVEAAFPTSTSRHGHPSASATSEQGAEASLLIGLLGFQTGLIDQSALIDAFRTWIGDKARPLGEILVSQGALDQPRRTLLEALVVEHLRLHQGDIAQSLASLPAGASTRDRLARLADVDLNSTLAHVGVGPTEPGTAADDRTVSYSVGEASVEGQRFRVLRPHARGGLGAVFVAMDQELHREVALKQILDRHADDPDSRARFLTEAEITGGLEHPGIVPVYGLGTYDDGRPYYAMRFIKGDSLKEAIDAFHADEAMKGDPGRRSLELRRLLRRFTDVCNAIDYAHCRGVLHRDLKPGNIIVGKYGETLVVDWGLAKPLGRAGNGSAAGERPLTLSSANGSAQTLPGSVMGTPAYMSPEQAGGELDRLGPRSDVYSLGATLYCLLTGRPPYEGEDIGEVLRKVQRGDVVPPRSLDAAIDPALEAVCLKAMALKLEDRYGSARSLAEDVERWAADEPVTAWREPFARRARRWGRRNRTAVTGATAALLAGLVGLSAVAAIQARSNMKLTEANDATQKALAETQKEKEHTEEALAQSEAVRTFLVEAFRGFDPTRNTRPVTVIDLLDRAAARLDKETIRSRVTKAVLLGALGQTYLGMGHYARAEALLENALALRKSDLGADHPDVLIIRNNLAEAYRLAGRTAEAAALHE